MVSNQSTRDMIKKTADFLYRYHIFTIICALGIIGLCLMRIPLQDNSIQIKNFDKIVHFLMYLFLGTAYLFESRHKRSDSGWKTAWTYTKCMVFCAALAGAVELAQAGVTDYRSGDWMDWYWGLAGAFTSCAVAGLFRLAFQLRGR